MSLAISRVLKRIIWPVACDILLFTQYMRENLFKSQGDAFNTLVRNQTFIFLTFSPKQVHCYYQTNVDRTMQSITRTPAATSFGTELRAAGLFSQHSLFGRYAHSPHYQEIVKHLMRLYSNSQNALKFSYLSNYQHYIKNPIIYSPSCRSTWKDVSWMPMLYVGCHK